MFLNPIIHFILAGVSLVIGASVTVEDRYVLLTFVPFLFFVTMFCLTLLRPVNKGQKISPERYRPAAPKPTPQFHRLTTEDLHSMRPFGRQH